MTKLKKISSASTLADGIGGGTRSARFGTRVLTRVLGVIGLAGAAIALIAGPASAAGPWYSTKSGSGYMANCDSHTSGGSNSRNGGIFLAQTNSGIYCTQSNVELIFVDDWGNELAWYNVANDHTPQNSQSYWNYGWFTNIQVSQTDYTRIIEVVGSSIAQSNGQQTQPGVYLYF